MIGQIPQLDGRMFMTTVILFAILSQFCEFSGFSDESFERGPKTAFQFWNGGHAVFFRPAISSTLFPPPRFHWPKSIGLRNVQNQANRPPRYYHSYGRTVKDVTRGAVKPYGVSTPAYATVSQAWSLEFELGELSGVGHSR